jgi:hypothetical protein
MKNVALNAQEFSHDFSHDYLANSDLLQDGKSGLSDHPPKGVFVIEIWLG